jgi:cobyrinic acid a,c-diamide synthase
VLVVDAAAMARSAAAMVHGYATFDSELRVAGVILNRVGSSTHERMLREAIEPLNIPVLGALRREADISTPDRHLGLVPGAERRNEALKALNAAGEVVAHSCDLARIVRLAATTDPLPAKPWSPEAPEPETATVWVAVASGPAFSFVYEGNLELLQGAGAEIATFDPTSDEVLPKGTDALYLGGGFPETYAEALSENEPLKKQVRDFARGGRPVVAECGGLLYLCRRLDGREMCSVLDAEARMTDRLSLGYREARALADSPLIARETLVRGHEFHYSAVEPQAWTLPAWEFLGRGEEGFIVDGVHASYLHTHWAATPEVPRRLVRSAAESKARAVGARA